jgi:hypothetical protein
MATRKGKAAAARQPTASPEAETEQLIEQPITSSSRAIQTPQRFLKAIEPPQAPPPALLSEAQLQQIADLFRNLRL